MTEVFEYLTFILLKMILKVTVDSHYRKIRDLLVKIKSKNANLENMPKPSNFYLPTCTFIRKPRLYGTSSQNSCTRLFKLWLSTVNNQYPKMIIPLHCAHSKMYTPHYLLVEQMHDRIHNFWGDKTNRSCQSDLSKDKGR